MHEGGWQVCSDRDGQVVFFTPKGKALFDAPKADPLFDTPKGESQVGAPRSVEGARADRLRPTAGDNENSVADVLDANSSVDLALPADHIRARLRARGIEPDHSSCGQRYRYDRFLPWQIEGAALDALERAAEADESAG